MKTTGLSRVSKDIIIRQIERELKDKPTFFVVWHGTVSANSMDKLRTNLRKANARYMAVKNSLAKRALKQAKLDAFADDLGSQARGAGLAVSRGDIVASSKILVQFAKENEAFKIQSAYLNGERVGADQVKTLASLPSREILIAKVVGGVSAPLSRFVGVLSGTLRQFVTVLDAIAKKKGTS